MQEGVLVMDLIVNKYQGIAQINPRSRLRSCGRSWSGGARSEDMEAKIARTMTLPADTIDQTLTVHQPWIKDEEDPEQGKPGS